MAWIRRFPGQCHRCAGDAAGRRRIAHTSTSANVVRALVPGATFALVALAHQLLYAYPIAATYVRIVDRRAESRVDDLVETFVTVRRST